MTDDNDIPDLTKRVIAGAVAADFRRRVRNEAIAEAEGKPAAKAKLYNQATGKQTGEVPRGEAQKQLLARAGIELDAAPEARPTHANCLTCGKLFRLKNIRSKYCDRRCQAASKTKCPTEGCNGQVTRRHAKFRGGLCRRCGNRQRSARMTPAKKAARAEKFKGSRFNAERVRETAARALEAADMRRRGMTWTQIAKALGYSHQTGPIALVKAHGMEDRRPIAPSMQRSECRYCGRPCSDYAERPSLVAKRHGKAPYCKNCRAEATRDSRAASADVEKFAEAARLRSAGLSLREIASRLGYKTASSAHHAVARGRALEVP